MIKLIHLCNAETVRNFCYRPGEACFKHKRAAEAVAEALAAPIAKPGPDADPVSSACYRPGEACFKHKRALEGLAARMATL
jgi:hypothetical protein